jgi:hypothetical protein
MGSIFDIPQDSFQGKDSKVEILVDIAVDMRLCEDGRGSG